MKSRKILLVTNDLGPHTGGIESFILGLLGEMDGSQVVIYTSCEIGSEEFDKDLAQKFGVVVIRDRAKVLLPTPRINRSVAKVMKDYDARFIWFGAAAPLGWMSGHLRRSGAKRIVALTHGHEVWWSKLWPFSLVMKTMAGQIDALGYLGEFTKRAMMKAVGDSTEMVRIAPGISIDHFTPGPKSADLAKELGVENKELVLCVGRLVHRKGQDRLIEAMPRVLKSIPNAALLIVGEGPRRDVLEKLVEKHNLEGTVRIVGRLSYDKLPEVIRLGDVFAMPSRSRFFGLEVEGLGIVYLEASACGVPILAGASGGAPDAVLEGETGLVVDGKNTDAIADSIIKLLNDAPLRQRMSVRGRQWAAEEWNWSHWGREFTQMLLGEKP
ncbi:MAG: glycosyltransferase family 4 protein [Actinomycetes bacterium]